MAKKYTLLNAVEYMLDSSDNLEGLEDSEPEDCNPPEDNTGNLEEDDYELEEECDCKNVIVIQCSLFTPVFF